MTHLEGRISRITHDTYISKCECGWVSDRAPHAPAAIELHQNHRRVEKILAAEEAGTIQISTENGQQLTQNHALNRHLAAENRARLERNGNELGPR